MQDLISQLHRYHQDVDTDGLTDAEATTKILGAVVATCQGRRRAGELDIAIAGYSATDGLWSIDTDDPYVVVSSIGHVVCRCESRADARWIVATQPGRVADTPTTTIWHVQIGTIGELTVSARSEAEAEKTARDFFADELARDDGESGDVSPARPAVGALNIEPAIIAWSPTIDA